MMRSFLTLVGHDLAQQLRDRSMLLFAVVIPLSLAFVFSLAFSGFDEIELDPVTVAVSAPEGDWGADAVREVLAGAPEQGLPVTVQQAGADEVTWFVEVGTADVGLVIPDGFAEALAAGSGADVELRLGEDAGLSGQILAGLVRSTVQRMDADSATIAAVAASPEAGSVDIAEVSRQLVQAQPQLVVEQREVSGRTLSASSGIVAGQAGMFLFFTVGFVVLTLLTEREWGTLARLRTMPIPRWLLPLAKAFVALLLGVTSTMVILVAGSLFLNGVHFGSWAVVLPLVVAVVAAATSVMFIILKVARTSEQASLAMSIIAITLGIGGGTFFRLPSEGRVADLVQINPVAALGRGLGITAGGGGLVDLAPVLLTLLAFTAAVLLIARVLPGRKDPL